MKPPRVSNVTKNVFVMSQVRSLSDNNSRGKKGIDEDPFGVNYKDSESAVEGEGNIGPIDDLPPKYTRDATTGKFTGMIQNELSQE